MKKLARELVSQMPRLTYHRSADPALEHAQFNLPFLEKTVSDLMPTKVSGKTAGSAIVVSGGPSLHKHGPVAKILRSGYDGPIICVDGALGYCLRNSLVPDYLLTLDPHRTRVVRWFGDPEFDPNGDDDYFRRQELDPYLGEREVVRNQELLELVNRYGPRIKVVIATSASPRVTRRCIESGMDLYWWNPLYDDFSDPDSLTKKVYELNKVPCMVTGGNVGTAAWVFAHAILGKPEVALVGMDFGYAPGTPIRNTQYYKEIEDFFGESAPSAFIDVRNPHLKETWFTDPAYYWYRQAFLEMARQADCTTFNCTGGGILFGKGVRTTSLETFLSGHSPVI